MKLIDVSTPKYPGLFAKVDDDDYEALSVCKWYASLHCTKLYACRNAKIAGKWRHIKMHRALFPDVEIIDHRDGDGLNNQRENLRPATRQTNQFNRRAANRGDGRTSAYRGVSFDSARGKWAAGITHNRKRFALGRFDDEVATARAYDSAAAVRFGEFACLNFP